jgi:rubrerythrin
MLLYQIALIESKESRTLQNLIELFAREAQTLILYRRFASTAQHEGFPAVAELFERLAQNQTVLVEGHLDFLRMACDPLSGLPLGQTDDNLKAALAGEEASGVLYPSAARTAEKEGYVDLASWFQTLAASKKAHRGQIVLALRQSSETEKS